MDRYTSLYEIMGAGANGTVWKAVDEMTGDVFAVKRMNRKFSTYEECLNLVEVRCMQELVHPNIVSLHDVILDSDTLYLVLECMDCDLSQLIRTRDRDHLFSEEEVRNLLFQIFKGLAYMHEKGYCHRDLKPNNLLLRGDTIKIADFGLSRNLLQDSGKPLQSYVVTRPYRAPELLLGSTNYNFAIDIWAMGVIMAQLLAGYQLFGGCREVNQIDKICSVIGCPDNHSWHQGLVLAASLNYEFPKEFRFVNSTQRLTSLIPRASAEAIDLIKYMLSWDPDRRPTARKALQYPFFIPCHNKANTPFPPPFLQSCNESSKDHSEQKPPYSDNGAPVFLNNSYSIWQQIVNSMRQCHPPDAVTDPIVKPFSVRQTSQINPMVNCPRRVATQTTGSDPLSFSTAYAIWRQIAYKGPYNPGYLSSATVRPFPGMESKLFNPTVQPQLPDPSDYNNNLFSYQNQ